ncbi:ComEA family DNA-binding protein [Immundisolibacter sp.]|uniref:ComEA family DNA-binding protein n=1 Tax=Immundisolibacter sp. TaxID=1934948 RepID=UPI0035672F48
MTFISRTVLALSFALGAGIATAATVDINCADAAALAAGLNGVGDAKAQAIVTHRAEMGLFKTADDLAAVKGIGAKTVEANRANITVSESCEAPAPQ